MEQNQVSDEELLKRINKVLNESKQERKQQTVDATKLDDTASEKFLDVYETTEESYKRNSESGELRDIGSEKNLALENHFLSLQLQAEKKKAKELQSKFNLLENSVKYFERLNGQLENIKKAVDNDFTDSEKIELDVQYTLEAMQKIRPKTVYTNMSGMSAKPQNNNNNNNTPDVYTDSLPSEDRLNNQKEIDDKEEVSFRDAEDFKLLEQGLEIVRDKKNEYDTEAEKVFITKNEKRCLEDIGNLASRTRTPLDDKHQRFFEKDRRKFAHSIVMPQIQEIEKAESVPPEIISKTNETPINITSTELDGLRSYLLQLKELIARRETAWARTTERDYNQRVEITRFKNEVGRLRMLCEKRQRDIKDRDQLIASKDEEIKELQKRIQGLRSAILKLEKKDERLMDAIDGVVTNEVLENSQIVQRSYNAMKRQSFMNRTNGSSNLSMPHLKPNPPASSPIPSKPSSKSRDSISRKLKNASEKHVVQKKGKTMEMVSSSNDEDWKTTKQKSMIKEKPKSRHKMDFNVLQKSTKDHYDKVGENLQKVEEMIHNDVLKEARKTMASGGKSNKGHADIKTYLKTHHVDKNSHEIPLHSKKLTSSNSTIRQEMLSAMTGLNINSSGPLRNCNFSDHKKNHTTATVIANALLAARNANMFNY